MRSRIASWLGNAVRVATLTGLVLHFVATLLYVLPLNPLKLEYGFLATMTIGTYFPQNWSLFAPNPVQSSQFLLVRCLVQHELPPPGGEQGWQPPTSGWNDVSSAHFEQTHRNPLSSYERLVRPLQNALRAYLGGGPDLAPFHDACKDGDQEACKLRDTAMKPRQAAAQRMLRGIASAFCRERFPERDFAAVALRFRERSAVPWSKRGAAAPEVTDYELGVYALDRTVALPGLYRSKQAP
jgi:hypothetical protein